MLIVFEEGYCVVIFIFSKFYGFFGFFFIRFFIIIIIIFWIMNFCFEGRKIFYWKGMFYVEIFYGFIIIDVIVFFFF